MKSCISAPVINFSADISESSNKKGKSNKGISNLTNTILSILKKDRNQSYNYKQIAAKLGVNDASSRNQIIKMSKRKNQFKKDV